MNMNPKEQRKVWPKKEQRRKGKEGGNQNKFTDPSITSVANVSQRENYCKKKKGTDQLLQNAIKSLEMNC